MTNGHLKPGELKELDDYLRTNQETVEHEDQVLGIAFSDDISALCEVKHTLDQARSETFSYEARSSFGRSSDEIKVNATKHISSCLPCFDLYIKDVQRIVLKTMAGFNRVMAHAGENPPEFSVERFFRLLKQYDYLGIFTAYIK